MIRGSALMLPLQVRRSCLCYRGLQADRMPPDSRYVPRSDDEDDVYDSDEAGPSSRPNKKQRGDYGETLSGNAARGNKKANGNYAWEASYNRSWDVVQEDEEGGLQAAVDGLLARGRRRRAQASGNPLRRSIIRHMFILIDLSDSMMDKDFRPNRFEVTLQYLRQFVVEWYDQNPLGQIGIIIMRDRIAEVIVEMGGNPQEVLAALKDKRRLEPSGEPSLQNGLQMAMGSMSHLPSTSSLEILVLFSSLSTADPEGPRDIHRCLKDLVSLNIRTSIIALAAELKICKQITEQTRGRFGVAEHEAHLKDLIWEAIPPPATVMGGTAPTTRGVKNALARGKPPAGDLMLMGFPTRLPISGSESLCACHSEMKKGGFLCPRCNARICDVPTDCEVCGLMVVSSPHLARSYWLLFPVAHYDTLATEVAEAEASLASACFGCDFTFPPPNAASAGVARVEDGVSPTGRYRCAKCASDFCGECDQFVHETLHACPGCS